MWEVVACISLFTSSSPFQEQQQQIDSFRYLPTASRNPKKVDVTGNWVFHIFLGHAPTLVQLTFSLYMSRTQQIPASVNSNILDLEVCRLWLSCWGKSVISTRLRMSFGVCMLPRTQYQACVTMLLMFSTFAVFYLCNTKMNKSTHNFFSINSDPNTTIIISAITFFAREAEIQEKTQRYLPNKAFSSTAKKFH